MMRKGLALLVLLTTLAGCGGVGPAADPGIVKPKSGKPAAPAAEVDQRLTAAGARFGLDLLREVYREKPGENHFLSPASAAVILTLAANGAKGETQQAMLQALRYEGMSLDEINQANGALQTILANPDPEVELSVANAVWYQKGLKLAPAFAAVAGQHYRAEVRPAQFGDPSAVEAINNWVSAETRKRIPRLLERTNADDVMWLVNALYFKGAWTHPFPKHATQPAPFHRVDGTEKQVPFMQQRAGFGYLKADGVKGARLPYGDDRLALYVIMPDRWDGFIDGLTAARWEGWMNGFTRQELILAMPKVKLEYQAELVEPLTAMGMGPAFGPADFSGLFVEGPGAHISQVIQKSFLEINEEGTEAAAATAVGVTTSAPPREPVRLVLDNPFLLAIRDDKTGALLFVGTLLEP